MSKTIGVFELGPVPDEVVDQYPDYATMITNWLSPALSEVEYVSFSPIRGDTMPSPAQCDGYVYSGSRYGVYDDVEWIAPLKTFIREVTALGIPQFGICFGHQIMAEALGGKAVKSDKGWVCGMQDYSLDQPEPGNRNVAMLALHQDQVIEAPPGAEIVGGNDSCPIGALAYREAARSVQFHPEFTNAYMGDLLTIRGGTIIPQDIADEARGTLNRTADASIFADWAAEFFRLQFRAA